MIDFSTLKGLTIPEGVVTQIADASGRVIWAVQNSEPVVLQVEKITSNTYAGETLYEGEQFILLDIYPKTNGTVSVTYGVLTKTITDTSGAAEPNAQQVFFGTFNGFSDSVSTPASGTLTIEGDCEAFACGGYAKDSKNLLPPICACVTNIISFSNVSKIPDKAFGSIDGACTKLTEVTIPSNALSIGNEAFEGCNGLLRVDIRNGVESIGMRCFWQCTALESVTIPASVVSIENSAFSNITKNNIISINGGNTHYKIDCNCLVEIATKHIVAGFNDSIIPDYITSIGSRAFSFCDFSTFTIPSSVVSMSYQSFYSCKNLQNLIVLATTPPTIESSTFEGSDAIVTIKVPKGCGDTYKSADGWSTYADYIVEASE